MDKIEKAEKNIEKSVRVHKAFLNLEHNEDFKVIKEHLAEMATFYLVAGVTHQNQLMQGRGLFINEFLAIMGNPEDRLAKIEDLKGGKLAIKEEDDIAEALKQYGGAIG